MVSAFQAVPAAGLCPNDHSPAAKFARLVCIVPLIAAQGLPAELPSCPRAERFAIGSRSANHGGLFARPYASPDVYATAHPRLRARRLLRECRTAGTEPPRKSARAMKIGAKRISPIMLSRPQVSHGANSATRAALRRAPACYATSPAGQSTPSGVLQRHGGRCHILSSWSTLLNLLLLDCGEIRATSRSRPHGGSTCGSR